MHARDALESVLTDPIDNCMKHYFEILQQKLSHVTNSTVDSILGFEFLPQRRPRILLQIAAHISGAARYYKHMTNSKHRMGVCIHPVFGGWFSIRGCFVFKQLLVPHLEPKMAPNVVPDEHRQAELLRLFNEHWQDNSYRDIIPVKTRYSSLQIHFYTLKPRERRHFIETTILPMLK